MKQTKLINFDGFLKQLRKWGMVNKFELKHDGEIRTINNQYYEACPIIALYDQQFPDCEHYSNDDYDLAAKELGIRPQTAEAIINAADEYKSKSRRVRANRKRLLKALYLTERIKSNDGK